MSQLSKFVRNSALVCALAASGASVTVPAVFAFDKASFKAYLKNEATIEKDDHYELVIEWDHKDSVAPVVGQSLARNAKKKGGACDPDAGYTAVDGISYWMPRFFPQKVSETVTKYTGVKFASPDWQPCGHKDIVICHGESHYDFHLYYQEEDFLKKTAGCDPNPKKPGHYIICDDITAKNHKMFSLMKNNIPKKRTSTADSLMPNTKVGDVKNVNYCMDPTSGVPMSGMHYGDRNETVNEWREPVTIMGSHDCTLSFFEPMISWKWITRRVYKIQGWPHWHSGEITYNKEEFSAVPKRWSVEVSKGCEEDVDGVCNIKVLLVGKKCPAGGCKAPEKNCANNNEINDCLTLKPFVSSFKPSTDDLTDDKKEYANSGNSKIVTTNEGCDYGGNTHCFTDDGKTILAGDKTATSDKTDAPVSKAADNTSSASPNADKLSLVAPIVVLVLSSITFYL